MKRKLISLVFLLVAFLFLFSSHSFAFSNGSEYHSIESQETLIINSFSCIANKNWDAWANYYAPEIRSELTKFLSNMGNHVNHVGILNVISASVESIYPVSNYKYWTSSYGVDEQRYTESNAFLVDVNFNTYTSDKYYHPGHQYILVLLVNQNGQWYKYAETIADDMVIAETLRQNGISNIPAPSVSVSPRAILTSPSLVRLYNGTTTTNVGFITYIGRVMNGEFNDDYFVAEARKAVAMAIKTFSWYHTIYPKHSALGADLCSSSSCCQSYKVQTVTLKNQEAINAILNTQAVKTVSGRSESGVVIASNGIWEAWYSKGSASSGNYKAGKLWQLGSQYLASQLGYDFVAILNHYYNDIAMRPCTAG